MSTRSWGDLRRGMQVLDVDGDPVGELSEIRRDAGYLVVSTGVGGHGTALYIPGMAIHAVGPDHVYLRVALADVHRLGWDAPPAGPEEVEDEPVSAAAPRATSAVEPGPGAVVRRVDEGATVQLRAEELVANKQAVEAGEVALRKEIVTEQQTVEVPFTREVVVIERHPVERRPADHPIGEGEVVAVPVYEEAVTVEKQAVVTEEITVGKQPVQQIERVSDTVRREVVDIEQTGNVMVQGSEPEVRRQDR